MTPSVASAAERHPLPHAYCAIAEPSSCATVPKLKASRPCGPKRFGPIWSVPMHGAIASTPRLIASCTTGAAKSTSQVVKITFAPWPSSFWAQAFANAGLFPWVSQVLITNLRPRTPPLAFSVFTRSCAAASAGLSNGAIAPLLSNAQPITTGDAFDDVVAAAAAAASAASAAAAIARVSPTRELGRVISTPFRVGRRSRAAEWERDWSRNGSGLPGAIEGLADPSQELRGRHVPERV